MTFVFYLTNTQQKQISIENLKKSTDGLNIPLFGRSLAVSWWAAGTATNLLLDVQIYLFRLLYFQVEHVQFAGLFLLCFKCGRCCLCQTIHFYGSVSLSSDLFTCNYLLLCFVFIAAHNSMWLIDFLFGSFSECVCVCRSVIFAVTFDDVESLCFQRSNHEYRVNIIMFCLCLTIRKQSQNNNLHWLMFNYFSAQCLITFQHNSNLSGKNAVRRNALFPQFFFFCAIYISV